MTINPRYFNSEVLINKENVVQIGLSSNNGTLVVEVDRATAARLINQLRKALDYDLGYIN